MGVQGEKTKKVVASPLHHHTTAAPIDAGDVGLVPGGLTTPFRARIQPEISSPRCNHPKTATATPPQTSTRAQDTRPSLSLLPSTTRTAAAPTPKATADNAQLTATQTAVAAPLLGTRNTAGDSSPVPFSRQRGSTLAPVCTRVLYEKP